MDTSGIKKLPCGNANFESIRTEGYAYVDKTRYIEMLEAEPNKNLFFTRSRKFGKSLFFSMLSHYYDVCGAEKFPALFGDLYIGKHPTARRGGYLVLKFNFSGIDTTGEKEAEEFYTGEEKLDMERFEAIGVIKNEAVYDESRLNAFERHIASLKKLGKWTRADLIDLFNDTIPEFNHQERGKFLDSKM